ncbi:hypothetical protein [Streptomyces sp. 11x1]|uniref:hypothetical protein n=1 Tax=Streptomyces sp. 11x1 TaxID=3038642 RepID=UPI00292F0F40|nr:hypothetical protein [Streptomyces sp. 11x1]WNZ14865.1 hypothetical protein P8T65_40055 [Streptomyces sp. 11x1]
MACTREASMVAREKSRRSAARKPSGGTRWSSDLARTLVVVSLVGALGVVLPATALPATQAL